MVGGGGVAYLSVRTNLDAVILVLLRSKRPVNEIQIHILELQLLQRVVDAPLHVLGRMQVLPHLCADEQVLALDVLVRVQELLDPGSYLVLVLVEPRAVEVSVTRLESSDDGAVRLAGGTDGGEGAKAEGGHGGAAVELDEGGGDGHGGWFGGCVGFS